jgi:hypothetical protein
MGFGIPPGFRTVLIMREVEEASVDETANVLGIKPETVRTRLHRARRMLLDSLGEQFAAVVSLQVLAAGMRFINPRAVEHNTTELYQTD